MQISLKCLYEKVRELDPETKWFLPVEKAIDLKRRGLRWSNVRLTTRKTLKKDINLEKNFEFHTYSCTRGVSALQFYEEDGEIVKLTSRDEISKKMCSFSHCSGFRVASFQARDKWECIKLQSTTNAAVIWLWTRSRYDSRRNVTFQH